MKKTLEEVILVEPSLAIATQLAVTMGKISRLDVPRDWPSILPFLMENIRHTDPDKQYRLGSNTFSPMRNTVGCCWNTNKCTFLGLLLLRIIL